jgi:hypothetical protein
MQVILSSIFQRFDFRIIFLGSGASAWKRQPVDLLRQHFLVVFSIEIGGGIEAALLRARKPAFFFPKDELKISRQSITLIQHKSRYTMT